MIIRALKKLLHGIGCGEDLVRSPSGELGPSTSDLRAEIYYAPTGTRLVPGEYIWQRENQSGHMAVVECISVIDFESVSDPAVIDRITRSLGGSTPGKDPFSGVLHTNAQVALLRVVSPLYRERDVSSVFHYLGSGKYVFGK